MVDAAHRRRREVRVAWRYAWRLLREFRGTLIGLCAAVAVGGLLHAITPLAALGGRRPPPIDALFAAWLALFGEPVYGAPETWYLAVVGGIYPLLGFALVGEGVVRFALLMVSRRRGEKEWTSVVASTYRDHVVLCGVGRLGIRVLEQLLGQGAQVVAIEKDERARYLEAARATGIPVLVRDMTDDAALLEAGVPHARVIILATNHDMANLEVALDARRINPRIRIAMRLFEQELAGKLSPAFGVDIAFSASALAAPIVAAMAIDAHVLASFSVGDVPHVVAELPVATSSALVGRTPAEVEAEHGVRVVARLPPKTGVPAVGPVGPGETLVVHAALAQLRALAEVARGG